MKLKRALLTRASAMLRYDKMSIDYCHKDRKHDKFPPDFKIGLHFVRPEDMGGFALTLNHEGSLSRSKFPSLDPEIVYGGLRILVKSAEDLRAAPCEGLSLSLSLSLSLNLCVAPCVPCVSLSV